MTNKEQYIQLCRQEPVLFHGQAWLWEATTLSNEWDAILISKAKRILAAMPYQVVRKWGVRAILLPIHVQYQPLYISPDAPEDIYDQLVMALEETCRENRIDWVQLQGFYPAPFVHALLGFGFDIQERTTYRIDSIPPRENLPASFSENKRRQFRKAAGLELVDLSPEDFYAFHRHCMQAQGKRIDYPEVWAQAVLSEAVKPGHRGRLLAARNSEGQIAAALFLAWDKEWTYYLLPTYDPAYKDSGAMTWLTHEALCFAHDLNLGFDFEGSMTPSIASSYKQFGGQATTYYHIERLSAWSIRMAVNCLRRFRRHTR